MKTKPTKTRSKDLPKSSQRKPARSSRARFALKNAPGDRAWLAGDFNGWDPQSLPLSKDADGNWFIELELPPGRHEYLFLVDGIWHRDPEAGEAPNPFGGINSVREIHAEHRATPVP